MKKVLTNDEECDILYKHSKLQSKCKSEKLKAKFAGVAQLVEQLICNQQVGGSSPSTSSIEAYCLGSRLRFLKNKIWENSRVAKGGRL